MVDPQANLAFGVGSIDRQVLLDNAIALERTATHADVPWTCPRRPARSIAYRLMPAIHAVPPNLQVERLGPVQMPVANLAMMAIVSTCITP
jgi:hypothetical protein